MDMTGFDIVVLLIVGALAALGAIRGFVTEILTLLAWVAAVVALELFYPAGKLIAAGMVGSEVAAAAIAFVVIFFGTFFLFRFVGRLLGDRTKRSVIGPIDRVLGLGFGAVKGLIVVSLVFLVVTRGHALIWGGNEKLPEWLLAAKTEPLLDITSRAIIDYAEDRQEGLGLGDDRPRTAPEDQHYSDTSGGEGYTHEERDALDDLLDDAGSTEI